MLDRDFETDEWMLGTDGYEIDVRVKGIRMCGVRRDSSTIYNYNHR